MMEWDIRNELFVCVCVCVCTSVFVCLGLILWIPACKRLYEFNMRVVKERSESTAGKRRNISSWMSTRLQITQSYQHNGERRGKMQKQTVQLPHTKRRTKVFMRTSVGLVLLCEMTANRRCYPSGTPRKVKHRKTTFLKKLKNRRRSERCDPERSGYTLCCLFECTDWSLWHQCIHSTGLCLL